MKLDQQVMTRRINWLTSIRDWQSEFVNSLSAREFVDCITDDLLGRGVFVFTPSGQVMRLPKVLAPPPSAVLVFNLFPNQETHYQEVLKMSVNLSERQGNTAKCAEVPCVEQAPSGEPTLCKVPLPSLLCSCASQTTLEMPLQALDTGATITQWQAIPQ